MAVYVNDAIWDRLSVLYGVTVAEAQVGDLYKRWLDDEGLDWGTAGDFFISQYPGMTRGDAEFAYWTLGLKPTVTSTNAVRTTDGLYTVLTFSSSGSLTVTGATLDVEYLVVAGGGAGGGAAGDRYGGGGGGAGGLKTNVGGAALTLLAATHMITVGAGGAGASLAGSSGTGSSIAALVTTTGGGRGGYDGGGAAVAGANGGSGGGTGGSSNQPGTHSTGVSGEGYGGGTGGSSAGGGGGGASAVGANGSVGTPGAGGNGTSVNITGTATTYAGGGGGSIYTTGTGAAGGSGGGGAGQSSGAAGNRPGNGTDGLGGGGGGGGTDTATDQTGGKGGDGIVIVRYPTANAATHTFTPLDLAPALWLDASDTATITASLGSVSQWDDKSGNGRNVTQGTAANQPTTASATQNGLNVLSWPTTTNSKVLASTSFTTQEVYIVARFGDGTRSTWYASYQGLFGVGSFIGIIASDSGSTLWGAPDFDKIRIDNGAESNAAGFTFLPRPASVVTSLSTSARTGAFYLGGDRNQGSRGWAGWIAEVVVFGSALSDANRTTLVDHLKSKWGIS